jgi:type VI protein secretion system component VasK
MRRAIIPITRKFKRHYGVSARNLTVRSKQPWYWQLGLAVMLVLLGYVIAYWHFTGGKFWHFSDNLQRVTAENSSLQAKVIQMERQLQVQQVAQNNLANDLKSLQDESLKLKQDVLFYKNMVNDKKHIQ